MHRTHRYTAIGLLALVLLSGCGGGAGDAEEALRAWLARGEQAAEARDRRALMGMVSSRYSDVRGNDRQAIDRLLRFYFLRQQKVTLVTRVDSLQIHDGTAADVRLTVGMAGSDGSLLGFDADAKQFRLGLELEGDEWQLISASWGELGETL